MNTQVKEWCRDQCVMQHATTEADFAGMEDAWDYAISMAEVFGNRVDRNDIIILGSKVDRIANPGGRFRTGPAVFMDGGSALKPQYIENMMNWWVNELRELSPGEAYLELMYIHPFKDGNGRVGALVYNWLRGSLSSPINPPEYK